MTRFAALNGGKLRTVEIWMIATQLELLGWGWGWKSKEVAP